MSPHAQYSRYHIADTVLEDIASGKMTAAYLSPEIAKMMLALRHAVKPRDSVSGFLKSNDIKRVAEDAMRRKIHEGNGEDMEVFCVGADISNLRGLNLILAGKNIADPEAKDEITKEANQLFGMVTNIFREELERVSPHHGLGENPNILFFHNGGDELSAVITRPKDASQTPDRIEIAQALKNITDRTSKLVRELGLGDIMHAGHRDKFSRRGFGISVAAKKIESHMDLENMAEQLDSAIEELKVKAQTHISNRRSRDQQTEPPAPESATMERRQTAAASGEGVHTLNGMVVQLDESRLKPLREIIRQMHARQGPIIKKHPISEELPFDILAPQHSIGLRQHGFEWLRPSRQRRHVIDIVLDSVEATHLERDMLNKAHRNYERHRLQRNFICDPIEPIVQDYYNFKKYFGNMPVHLMAFEIQNFKGLNDTFGHEGCDDVFNHMTQGLNSHGRYDESLGQMRSIVCRPGGKGSIVYVLTPGRTADEINRMAQAFISRAENHINDSYSDAVNHNFLRTIQNPRHPDKPGTRMVGAVVKLGEGKVLSVQEAMHELREQLNHNIANDVLFDAKTLGIEGTIKNTDFVPVRPDVSLANLADALNSFQGPDAHTERLASKRAHATLRAKKNSR